MLDPDGGFYSTQDAGSEGEEGKFFVWTLDEIQVVLGEDAEEFIATYSVTRHGNTSTGSAHGFEGKNILEFVGDMDDRPALAEARHKLFDTREKRVHPGRDEKVLTSWNGLKPAGFTNDLRYVDIAHQALVQMQPMIAQYPLGLGQWLQALAYALSKPREIACGTWQMLLTKKRKKESLCSRLFSPARLSASSA